MRLPSECYQMQKTIEPHVELAFSQPHHPRAAGACQNAVASALSPWSNWYNLAPLREWRLIVGLATARLRCQTELDVTLCFAPTAAVGPLLVAVGRLALAIDPTLKGDQTTVSVVYRSCAIPVAWHDPARRGARLLDRGLQALAPAVPENMTVIVLCDRGIASPKLAADTGSRRGHPRYALPKEHHFLR